jgi:hypothetical protein
LVWCVFFTRRCRNVYVLLFACLLRCTLVEYVLNRNHNLFTFTVLPFSCVAPASTLEVFRVEPEIITLCDFETCENYNKDRQVKHFRSFLLVVLGI